MSQHEFQMKLTKLKENIKQLVHRRWKSFKTKKETKNELEESIDVYMEDLPLTLSRDSGPNITYYPTENSKFAKGASKKVPRALDHFEERGTL